MFRTEQTWGVYKNDVTLFFESAPLRVNPRETEPPPSVDRNMSLRGDLHEDAKKPTLSRARRTYDKHNDVLRRNGRLRHAKPIEQTHLTNRLVVSCVRGGKREESASEQDQSRLSRELPVAAGFGAMTGRYTPGSTSSLQHESPRLRFKRELRVKFLQKAPTEIVGPKSLKITANGSTVQVAAVDNGHSSHDFTMVNSN